MGRRADRQRTPAYYEFSLRSLEPLCIAGVDEVGRGPLAGPVIAAAVIFPSAARIPGITDSKKLTAKQREALFPLIREKALAIGLGFAEAEEVDRINILQAALKAMKTAVLRMPITPDLLLVDGNRALDLTVSQQCLIRGDARSLTIGAASIVAKVIRDKLMETCHLRFPEYNFSGNKGYGTREHLEALRRYGPCPLHRRTFRGVVLDGQ
ncbi:MAG: ribonuclease HII [Desulfobacteraceae bacterium]|nr:MAG: ribonuclease HII [Desulfobacteraceae bacterium]